MHWSQFFWPRERTNRAPYWVLGILSNVFFNWLDRAMPNPSGSLALAIGIASLVAGYVGVCLFIGRLHDIDRSGWWSLPILLAMTGLVAASSSPELQELFRGHDTLAWILVGVLFVVGVGGAFYVGLKPGTQGPNRFGHDPLVKPNPR